MPVDTDELQRQIDEVRLTAEDALDKFPLRSTTTPGAVRERHIHDLGKHPGGVIAARVHNSGNLTITTATSTVLTLDSERYDTDSIHSTSSNTGRLTAKTAGKYSITGHIRWDAASGGRRELRILLNGATVIAEDEIGSVADATALPGQVVSTHYDLAVDDFVELQVRHTQGSNLNVRAESNFSPEFMMARVGAAGTSGGGTPGTDHGALTGLSDDDHSLYLLAAGSREGSTGGAQSFGSTGIKADVIAEDTAAAGVTIDSVLLKDDVVQPTITGRFRFGPAVVGSPMLRKFGATIEVRKGDDSGYAALTADILSAASRVAFKKAQWQVGTAVTLSNDSLSLPNAANIKVLAQTGTADNLDEIAGTDDGTMLLLHPDVGDTITIRHNQTPSEGGEKILCQGNADVVLDDDHDTAMLMRDGDLTAWRLIAPSTTAHGPSQHTTGNADNALYLNSSGDETEFALVAGGSATLMDQFYRSSSATGAPDFTELEQRVSFTLEDPVVNDNLTIAQFNQAVTVREVHALVTGGTSVDFNIYMDATRTTETTKVFSADKSLSAGTTMTRFTPDTAAVAADDILFLDLSAVSGTPTEFHITLRYTTT